MQKKQAAFADLHTHSTASDGTNSPSVNVRLAFEADLAALALTDHDTVAGVKEAMAAGAHLGLLVVPGVEISTEANGQDIHMLGYFIDIHDPVLLQRLEELRETRNRRNAMMLEKLSQLLGTELTMDEVLSGLSRPLGPDETVGRPHIADLLVRRGFVSTIQEAFDRYLGREGAAYVNPPRIRPEQAIDWIHEAGGVAVIAHPVLYGDDELVERLLDYGADGLEADHADHKPDDVRHYREMAERHQVLATAGSDFHGERGGHVFHAPLGSRRVDVSIVDDLLARSMRYR